MIEKTGCLLFLLLSLTMAACTSTPTSSLPPTENHPAATATGPSKTIAFPRQKKTNGEWAAMDALTRGTLVLADNCLRLERDKSLANYLLIWPPDFNVTIENGKIEILNEKGEIVASPGDNVQMSGGEIHLRSMLEQSIQDRVPPQCAGPYWIIGDEFTQINPAQ
jgi:hypothetical protein